MYYNPYWAKSSAFFGIKTWGHLDLLDVIVVLMKLRYDIDCVIIGLNS